MDTNFKSEVKLSETDDGNDDDDNVELFVWYGWPIRGV